MGVVGSGAAAGALAGGGLGTFAYCCSRKPVTFAAPGVGAFTGAVGGTVGSYFVDSVMCQSDDGDQRRYFTAS